MKLPGTALIATVYNEASTIRDWLAALAAQASWPEEFVIVDGVSKDNTAAIIAGHVWPSGFPVPKVIIQKCNIAGGRNIAIKNCRAEIIASTDAGSLPDAHWFDEIVKPLIEMPGIEVIAGKCLALSRTPFQRRLAPHFQVPANITSGNCMPSSRNVAFRRAAWAAVGGYPEWLTLTAEDALFNHQLRASGFQFYYQPSALVTWEGRPDLKSYLKMMYSYGYGSAEAGQAAKQYLRCLLTTFVPPLIFFSSHPLADVPLRYVRNAATSLGWLAGKIQGRKPPAGWRRLVGVWISPEAQAHQAAAATEKKKLLLAWQRAFRQRDFCIVTNNCWGAHIYQALGWQYQTPFIGLYLMPDCYLNLLENFHDFIRRPLLFKKKSRYESINRRRSETNQFYPIAELAPGVEIQFLHYASEQEALAKWSRRVLRIPPPTENQRLFFKFCDCDGLTQDHLKRFAALPFKNKVCFSSAPWPDYRPVVHIRECQGNRVPDGFTLSQISYRYFDALDWLQGGTGVPNRRSIL